MNERPLHHVGIAVESIDEALPIWEKMIGSKGSGREIVASQNVEVVFLGTGAGRVELIAPTSVESSVAKFLDRRGQGLHHLCYQVPDLRAALEAHAAEGYELIDREPRAGSHDHQVAFLHPRSTGGVLIELLEPASASRLSQ